jgi:hypothetical protein
MLCGHGTRRRRSRDVYDLYSNHAVVLVVLALFATTGWPAFSVEQVVAGALLGGVQASALVFVLCV